MNGSGAASRFGNRNCTSRRGPATFTSTELSTPAGSIDPSGAGCSLGGVVDEQVDCAAAQSLSQLGARLSTNIPLHQPDVLKSGSATGSGRTLRGRQRSTRTVTTPAPKRGQTSTCARDEGELAHPTTVAACFPSLSLSFAKTGGPPEPKALTGWPSLGGHYFGRWINGPTMQTTIAGTSRSHKAVAWR